MRFPFGSSYADFTDFAFYRMAVLEAHLVAGFGRIVTLPADRLLADADAAARIAAAEPRLIAECNDRLVDAVRQAGAALGGQSGPWLVIGADVDGVDLGGNSQFLRLSFDAPVDNADAWWDAAGRHVTDVTNKPRVS